MGLFFKFLILVLLVFFATESQAQFKPAEQQYLGESNISINGGFEQGKTNWTNINGTFAVGSTNKLFGQNAGCVTLTAQSLSLTNTATTTSMDNIDGYVVGYAKSNFSAEVCSIVDNAEVTCLNILSDNVYRQYKIPVTNLGTTNLGIRFKSASQTGTLCADDIKLVPSKITDAVPLSQAIKAPNMTDVKVCFYAFGGAGATLASPTECAPTTTCTEVFDNCNSVSPPSINATGIYTDLTFANGTFKNSSFLHCDCKAYDTNTGEPNECVTYFITPDNTWRTNASGGAILNIVSNGITGTTKNSYISIRCEAESP